MDFNKNLGPDKDENYEYYSKLYDLPNFNYDNESIIEDDKIISIFRQPK